MYKKKPSSLCYIIQARLNSKRIPQKMIRPFAGTTLSDIALSKIHKSNFINKGNFYFAVYDEPLKAIADKYSLQVFHRSKRSSDAEDSLQEIYEWHNQLDYDYVIKINGCSPFLTIQTIDNFIQTFLEIKHDGLFGVIKKKNYFWSSTKKLITPWPKGLTIMNTKVVEPTYEGAHCLYASRMDTIKDDVWMGSFQKENDPALFILSEQEAFDIDYLWQFEMAEALYKKKLNAVLND